MSGIKNWGAEPRLDDVRWNGLRAGYRLPYDPRPALERLAGACDDSAAWEELWNELHHQGDIGPASFASVPHLVAIHATRCLMDWNTYALVGTIELCRAKGSNPDVEPWLSASYFSALNQLADLGREQLVKARDPTLIRSILGVVAIASGLRILGSVALEFTEDELRELLWPNEEP